MIETVPNSYKVEKQRCDCCGEPADTIHFISDGRSYPKPEESPVRCYFACVKHDYGGYWAPVRRWNDPREKFPEHAFEKAWGSAARTALEERLNGIAPPWRKVSRAASY